MAKDRGEKRTLRITTKYGGEYVIEFPTEEACVQAKKILDEKIRARKGMIYV